MVAPADGRVVSVTPAVPPSELGLGAMPRWRVSTFLSIINVHVNRIPADGIITRIAYRHGSFLNASLDKASEVNERNAVALRLPDGREIAVVQIAGLIARRIVCDLREGDAVHAGQRFGIIRFGSRTDLYLPEGVRPLVAVGQTMVGGETVIAELGVMSGSPRPDWHAGTGRVSPINRLRRLRPRARPRFKGLSFNRIVPNLLTLIGLCAGLTSMRFAYEGRFGSAAVAIVVAGAIDGLDGRLARLLKATSRFGAELDSLADFLCFGVAPAFIAVLWSLQRAGGFGYTPCLIFAVCMALRLARFNAALDSAPGPAYAYNFFTGVPAPPGAGVALFPLFLGLEAKSLGLGLAAGGRAVSAVLRLRAGRHGAAAGLDPAGLELQELQGAARVRAAAAARRRDLRRGAGRRSLGRARRRRPDLPRHAAVQRTQLPPAAARGRGNAGGGGALNQASGGRGASGVCTGNRKVGRTSRSRYPRS